MTRGVLIDVAALKGVDMLPDRYEITVDDLQQALERQGVALEPGDAVLIHTGWGVLWDTDAERFMASNPAIGVAAAQWLVEHDPMLLGADNQPVEVSPNPDPELSLPIHQIMLVVNGIHLVERMKLDELAAARRARVRVRHAAAQDAGRDRFDGRFGCDSLIDPWRRSIPTLGLPIRSRGIWRRSNASAPGSGGRPTPPPSASWRSLWVRSAPTSNTTRLEEVAKALRKRARWTSPLKSEIPLRGGGDDPAARTEPARRARTRVRERATLSRRSVSRAAGTGPTLAALLLALRSEGRPVPARQVERLASIYRRWRKDHFWLTSANDLPAAALARRPERGRSRW